MYPSARSCSADLVLPREAGEKQKGGDATTAAASSSSSSSSSSALGDGRLRAGGWEGIEWGLQCGFNGDVYDAVHTDVRSFGVGVGVSNARLCHADCGALARELESLLYRGYLILISYCVRSNPKQTFAPPFFGIYGRKEVKQLRSIYSTYVFLRYCTEHETTLQW
jgi:hypothetical protein